MREVTVLVVEDEKPLREILGEFLSARGLKIFAAANCLEAEHICRNQRPDAAILDYELPDGNALQLLTRVKSIDTAIPIIILTGHGSIQLAVDAIKLGAAEFLTKPVDLNALYIILQRSLENRRNQQSESGEKSRPPCITPDIFMGTSRRIRELSELAHRVLQTSRPILLRGETGTGKSVLARWLHQNGPRQEGPFVDLNCADLSRELLETELFGHEKGAFTGAVQSKVGLLEIGDHGTVFLDEVGDLDLQVQPKLLKALEEKKFRRVGDVRERSVDVHLITATHRDLSALLHEKRFRQDLYFRISTIVLTVPPLRDRVADIPLLARWLLEQISADLGVGADISDDALQYLQAYAWPGNIRELRNTLERAVLLGNQTTLTSRDLHFDAQAGSNLSDGATNRTLNEIERAYIERVLTSVGGRVSEAAKKLGLPRSSLYSKIRNYQINVSHGEPTEDHARERFSG